MLNNSSNLYGSEWLALVFRNRNQSYGAFVLRQESSNIMMKAIMIVVPLFVMLFVGPLIYSQMRESEATVKEFETPVKIEDAPIHEMKKEQPKEEPKPEPEKAAAPPQEVQAQTTAFSNKIEIVDEPAVEPPTSIELKQTAIASTTQEGASGIANAQPIGDKEGGTGTSTEGALVGNEIYETAGVEVYPEFPGGMAAWSKFIERNLRYPYSAQDNQIQGKVYLSFVIEKDGSVTEVKVIRGIGYGCDDEAVRVIKKSPKWKPGKQNQQNVRVRYQMPINYMLTQ